MKVKIAACINCHTLRIVHEDVKDRMYCAVCKKMVKFLEVLIVEVSEAG